MPRLLFVCGSQVPAEQQSPFGEIVALLKEFISGEQTATLDYEQVVSLTDDAAVEHLAATLAIVELSPHHAGAATVVRRIRQQSPEAKIICYFEGGKNEKVEQAAKEWGANSFVLISASERHPHRLLATAAIQHLQSAV